jgi:hypothetical protein
MKERRICSRCVLPESKPDLWLDEAGVCNVCVQHDAMKGQGAARPSVETDFTRIIEKHRGKGEYDCLVMCSGGKDSTSALYYVKERYKLRPLAFTFDHGFETQEAMDNVRRAVEVLDVDYMTFRSTFMHDMFERILKTSSKVVICHLCSIWYMDLTFKLAARFKIPIIIAGWTKGQSTDQEVMSKCACNIDAPEFAAMAKSTLEFLATLEGDPKYGDFPRSMEEVLKRAKKRHKSIVLSPHWFLPFDTETYVDTIQSELGWKYPELSYPGKSTNCALNFISVYNSMKTYGYTHYHVEMSKHIREGLMTREEALELLEVRFDAKLLNEIAKPLGYTFE